MNTSSSQENTINSLKSIDFFSCLSDSKLESLLNDCREMELSPGDILFKEGDIGDSMYVVLSGEVLIEKENTTIAHRGRGDYFGEMTLLESKPRSATITAVSKSRLLEISEPQFHHHFASNSETLLNVLKTVSERSRENLTALGQGMQILKTQKKANADLQHLLDDTTNDIYIFDAESYYLLSMNSHALNTLGYEKHEITQLTLFKIMSDMNQDLFEELTKPLQSDKKEEVVYKGEHRRRDGSQYPVEVRFKLQKTETPPVYVGIAQDISQLQELENKNNNLTFYDTLTGLPNKQLILEKLSSELLPENRGDKSVAVLLIDLDDFKVVNDSMGHKAGDQLLKAATERLINWAPSDYRIARFGGDEFMIILSKLNFETEAAGAASELLKLFHSPFIIDAQEAYVGISVGISYYPVDGHDSETLIKHADTAMYFAKENGKNTYCHYSSDMEAQAKNKLILERDLRKALEKNQFELYYQPKLALDSETVIGFEALVRWNHPTRGLVSPLDFIPLAEKTKLIIPLGEWILRTACKQIKKWLDLGFALQNTAVNLSAHQFSQPDLVEKIGEIIQETAIQPEYLELEITESVLMENAEMAANQLKQLNGTGIKISIDDFGTGYSSLSYLNSFPLDNLKVDRAFVKDITCEEDASLAKAVISIAKALNLKTIAEGVETETQKEVLRSIGCDVMQGYLLSKPLPADEATKFLSHF
jgi:diguanylate cyclase (GGDEF)-like protein/PAS domain S-box-containing protein